MWQRSESNRRQLEWRPDATEEGVRRLDGKCEHARCPMDEERVRRSDDEKARERQREPRQARAPRPGSRGARLEMHKSYRCWTARAEWV